MEDIVWDSRGDPQKRLLEGESEQHRLRGCIHDAVGYAVDSAEQGIYDRRPPVADPSRDKQCNETLDSPNI